MKYLNQKAKERIPLLLDEILIFLEKGYVDSSVKKSQLKCKIRRAKLVLEGKYIN